LGIQAPAQNQGLVLWDLIEGYEMVRERPNPTPEYGPTKHYKEWLQHFMYGFGLLKDETNPC
jgi:hypothetical protein